MRNKSANFLRFLIVLALITVVGACAKKNVPGQPGFGGGEAPGFGAGGSAGGPGLDDARWRELGINSEAEKREFLDRKQAFENQDIYFDYDAYTLSEPAKRILDDKIGFLKRYAKVRVSVEGHCDERGTTEYNLALGERRANSCSQYISNSGLHAQLTTTSYGKERPIATGHDEASWAKNRRAHFVVNF